MKLFSEFVGRHVGRRGSVLLGFAFVDFVYCWSLATAADNVVEANATYRWFNGIMPLWIWAGAWGVVACVCTWAAFDRQDRYGFMAAIGIKVVWAIGSVAGWVLDGVSLGGVGIWLGFAFIVWRVSGWSEPVIISEDL